MRKFDTFVQHAILPVAEIVSPRIAAAHAARSTRSLDELPGDVARDVISEAMASVPADALAPHRRNALMHWVAAFTNPTFTHAIRRIEALPVQPTDGFDMVMGRDYATVMAGLGMPVAAFDRTRLCLLTAPSNDLDVVARTFTWKTAYVGYSSCEAPYYVIVTDCVQTSRDQIERRPELEPIKTLLDRSNFRWPTATLPSFRHAAFMLARWPGDRFNCLFVPTDVPDRATIALLAGWKDARGCHGGLDNRGFRPVMRTFAQSLMLDPRIALWLWRTEGEVE